TTQELAKSAEKYQQQMSEALKQTQQSIKESTNSFLSSLDKLKVPEAGQETLQKLADNIKQIDSQSNNEKAVQDIVAAEKARGDTQVETIKALAQTLGPNSPIAPRAPPKPQGPTIAERLQNFQSSRNAGSMISDPLGNAMAAAPQG